MNTVIKYLSYIYYLDMDLIYAVKNQYLFGYDRKQVKDHFFSTGKLMVPNDKQNTEHTQQFHI